MAFSFEATMHMICVLKDLEKSQGKIEILGVRGKSGILQEEKGGLAECTF